MFTNSKQVFDVATCGKRLTEWRLAIDVSTAREAYARCGKDRIGLVCGKDNSSNAMRNLRRNKFLVELVERGVDSTPVQE